MSSFSLPTGWNADETAGAGWPCWARRWQPAWKLAELHKRSLEPSPMEPLQPWFIYTQTMAA